MLNFILEIIADSKRDKYLKSLPIDSRLMEFTSPELHRWAQRCSNYEIEMILALDKKLTEVSKFHNGSNEDKIKLMREALAIFTHFITLDAPPILEPHPRGVKVSHVNPSVYTRMMNNSFVIGIFIFVRDIVSDRFSEHLLEVNLSVLKEKVGFYYSVKNPSDSEIKDIFLSNGFKEKDQGEGRMDLNPYVYDSVRALLNQIRIR